MKRINTACRDWRNKVRKATGLPPLPPPSPFFAPFEESLLSLLLPLAHIFCDAEQGGFAKGSVNTAFFKIRVLIASGSLAFLLNLML